MNTEIVNRMMMMMMMMAMMTMMTIMTITMMMMMAMVLMMMMPTWVRVSPANASALTVGTSPRVGQRELHDDDDDD